MQIFCFVLTSKKNKCDCDYEAGMGGQNSRMVKEIMEDSLYIIRQTNRATYERSVQAHQEVASKIDELREMNKQMIHSTQQDDVRSELFKTLQGVDSKKKQLDQVVCIVLVMHDRPHPNNQLLTLWLLCFGIPIRWTASPSSSSCPRATRRSPTRTAWTCRR